VPDNGTFSDLWSVDDGSGRQRWIIERLADGYVQDPKVVAVHALLAFVAGADEKDTDFSVTDIRPASFRSDEDFACTAVISAVRKVASTDAAGREVIPGAITSRAPILQTYQMTRQPATFTFEIKLSYIGSADNSSFRVGASGTYTDAITLPNLW
jgi:hypothetical protein